MGTDKNYYDISGMVKDMTKHTTDLDFGSRSKSITTIFVATRVKDLLVKNLKLLLKIFSRRKRVIKSKTTLSCREFFGDHQYVSF